jgi:hypothetical protein
VCGYSQIKTINTPPTNLENHTKLMDLFHAEPIMIERATITAVIKVAYMHFIRSALDVPADGPNAEAEPVAFGEAEAESPSLRRIVVRIFGFKGTHLRRREAEKKRRKRSCWDGKN